MKQEQPNWEKLLTDNFGFKSLHWEDTLHEIVSWMRSWMREEATTNTPLHRKKCEDGTNQ